MIPSLSCGSSVSVIENLKKNKTIDFCNFNILNTSLTLHFVLFLIIIIFISFLANASHFIHPENTRKPLVFWCFQEILIEKIGQKLVKINPTLRE